MSRPSLLIVGGGLVGRALAWRMAAHHDVALVTDGQAAASSAAAGMLAPAFEALHDRAVPALHALLEDSLAYWDVFAHDLMAASDQNIDYRRNGIIGIDFPPGALPGAVDIPLPEGIRGTQAVCLGHEGQVDPRRVLTALTIACERAGVASHIGQVDALVTEGGVCRGVSLDDGTPMLADRVVIATGARAALVPHLQALMVPVRGRAYRIALPDHGLDHVIRTGSIYLCPKADGSLYLGATEETADGEDNRLDDLWQAGCELFPALVDGQVTAIFDGQRPGIRGGEPRIGRDGDVENLYVGLGLDRNGVLLTPIVTDRLVRLLTEDQF
ncbi:NAD(P)/FAD-dependent oxidoreductase [Parvularcula sp. LCG005]|uniref:NAD(P)/FAD-dependent oxidoreductase n=1 Tax=Parvularcula sp. LCG005 TaxID=3078805 RepID=UPI002942AA2D|nr:FAD-dependent oxidoreductase [Parvularcula sp. LCG005]WOI54135.1 FAD-dependent oxidoreductase [Parvularcula sp. LCG005]